MLYVAVCEDDSSLLANIKNKVQNYFKEENIMAMLETYDRSDLLKYDIQEGKYFDLVLSDIEMPDTDGMKIAEQVRSCLPDAIIIFVTAYLKYAVDAYELHIFRYIPKNQLKERLPHALKDAVSLLEIQNTDSYIISSQNRLERIPYKEILYIGKDGKNALFHTTASGRQEEIGTDRNRRVRKTLAEVFDELHSEEFYFIERGYIVNLRHVTGISHTDCILTDQTRLPVSQSRLPELKKRLNKYWQDKI